MAEDPGYEHTSFLHDVELVKQADKHGFKYAWLSEHHFLEEYSHLSASEVFLGYLAGVTERIHLGSAIWNISPPVNHPVRVAERVTMMDHLSRGRFEFGWNLAVYDRMPAPVRTPSAGETATVIVQGRGQSAGPGVLLATLNPGHAIEERITGRGGSGMSGPRPHEQANEHEDQDENTAAHVTAERLELQRVGVRDLGHHQGPEPQRRDDEQGQHPMHRHE